MLSFQRYLCIFSVQIMRIFTLKKLWHKQLNSTVKEFRINVLAYRIRNALHRTRSVLCLMRSVYHSHHMKIERKVASFLRYLLLSFKIKSVSRYVAANQYHIKYTKAGWSYINKKILWRILQLENTKNLNDLI